MQHTETPTPINLYWIDTVDMFGHQLIELKTSTIEAWELSDIPEDQLTHIGNLTTKNGNDFEKLGGEPSNEEDMIKYAKETLKIPIPDEYKLICIF